MRNGHYQAKGCRRRFKCWIYTAMCYGIGGAKGRGRSEGRHTEKHRETQREIYNMVTLT